MEGKAVEVIGTSLLSEKIKHGSMIAVVGGGVTTGTAIGYLLAIMALASSGYVIYKTYLEIQLIKIRIAKESKE